jgi:ferritin-like protein
LAQSAGLHEDAALLAPATVERHRAIVSIQEELEAIDWYDQRVDASSDPELKDLLAHNRDEEKEHAAMVIEWLRRRDPAFDQQLRAYLFTTTPLLQAEKEAVAGDGAAVRDGGPAGDGSLGVGSPRGRVR